MEEKPHHPDWSLSRVFQGAGLTRCDVAHICIDPQRHYAISDADERTARHIGESLVPQFRRMGIESYWVYNTAPKRRRLGLSDHTAPLPSPAESAGGFCKGIKPAPGEKIIPKTTTSAFESSGLPGHLAQDKRKILLVSGFTFWVCIADTVEDARRSGYEVIVLRDGTDYCPDATHIQDKFDRAGIITAESKDVWPHLTRLPLRSAMPQPRGR